jgi:hypothetical protein
MKPQRAWFNYILALVAACLLSGCATVSGEKDTATTSQNSPWLDPDVPADYGDMTTAQKIAYCALWPVLEVGKMFCGHTQ